MELNSTNINEVNKRLQQEAAENKIALQKLEESLRLMQNGEVNPKVAGKELNLLDLANIICKETERRQNAEKSLMENLKHLEKINRELDQFAYIVSHDLKAPLRAIASLADWIKEDSAEELTEESKQNLEILRNRVTRMENLIHGILTYSKAGKARTERTIINIEDLLNDVIDSLNPPSNIIIETPSKLPSIITEATKLQQVFANLISNSIKYNDKIKGEIKISYLQLEDKCQFIVEDNGPGIEKEFHERIFMIFQTLSTRDEIESTGIGLSIVKKIIEDQGGKIWVESEINNGSRFIFTWTAIPTNTLKIKS